MTQLYGYVTVRWKRNGAVQMKRSFWNQCFGQQFSPSKMPFPKIEPLKQQVKERSEVQTFRGLEFVPNIFAAER